MNHFLVMGIGTVIIIFVKKPTHIFHICIKSSGIRHTTYFLSRLQMLFLQSLHVSSSMLDWPQHQLCGLAEVWAGRSAPLTAGDAAWGLQSRGKTPNPGPAPITSGGQARPDGELVLPTKVWVGGKTFSSCFLLTKQRTDKLPCAHAHDGAPRPLYLIDFRPVLTPPNLR